MVSLWRRGAPRQVARRRRRPASKPTYWSLLPICNGAIEPALLPSPHQADRASPHPPTPPSPGHKPELMHHLGTSSGRHRLGSFLVAVPEIQSAHGLRHGLSPSRYRDVFCKNIGICSASGTFAPPQDLSCVSAPVD